MSSHPANPNCATSRTIGGHYDGEANETVVLDEVLASVAEHLIKLKAICFRSGSNGNRIMSHPMWVLHHEIVRHLEEVTSSIYSLKMQIYSTKH
jgi:hypothetical protein